MRRSAFTVVIAAGALWLGATTFLRGQRSLGIVFIGIALLRTFSIFGGRRKPKPPEAIRLGLTEPPGVLRYPPLPPHLKSQLDAITPSLDGELHYHPCLVKLHHGDTLDCVYLVSEAPYIKHWAVYPNRDSGKAEIRSEDVASLAESPSRLPPQFANELYRAGESGMGYTIFTVVFADGSRQAYQAGNAVDFIQYPEGKGPADVAALLPHEGRNEKPWNAPDYSWCIYSE